jgi:hypothetical protein
MKKKTGDALQPRNESEPFRSMLSPLHALLDERVMEFTLANYNLVNTPNLIPRILTNGKKPQ